MSITNPSSIIKISSPKMDRLSTKFSNGIKAPKATKFSSVNVNIPKMPSLKIPNFAKMTTVKTPKVAKMATLKKIVAKKIKGY